MCIEPIREKTRLAGPGFDACSLAPPSLPTSMARNLSLLTRYCGRSVFAVRPGWAPLGGRDTVASDAYEDPGALMNAGPIADYNRLLANELLRFGGRREDKRRAVFSFVARHGG